MKLRSLLLACGLLTSVSAFAGGSQTLSERVDGFWDGGRSPSVRALQGLKFIDFLNLGGYLKFPQKVAVLPEEVETVELVDNPIGYKGIFPLLLEKPHVTSLKISIDPHENAYMSDESFAELLDYLTKTKTLKKFDFYQMYIFEDMGRRFAGALAQNTSIKSFSLTALVLGAEAIHPFSGVPGQNRQNQGALETLGLTSLMNRVKHEEACGKLQDFLAGSRPGFTIELPLDENSRQWSYKVQEDGKIVAETSGFSTSGLTKTASSLRGLSSDLSALNLTE